MFLTVFPIFYAYDYDYERVTHIALCSFPKSDLSDLLSSLFTKEWYKRFAQVAHDKRAMGAICSFSQVNHSFAHKNKWIARKTDDQIPNPGSLRQMLDYMFCDAVEIVKGSGVSKSYKRFIHTLNNTELWWTFDTLGVQCETSILKLRKRFSEITFLQLLRKYTGLGIRSSIFWANCSFLAKNERMSDSLKKRCNLLIRSFLVSNLSDSLMVTHFWWANWANLSWSLTSLTKNEGMIESLILLYKKPI